MYRFIFLIVLYIPFNFNAQSFVDVGQDQNLGVYVDNEYLGCGVSFFDVNNDGWDDITFTSNTGRPYLFLNNSGDFVLQSFLDTIESNASKCINWVDFDNDGDNDFFMTRAYDSPILLENEGNMVFNDISEEAGFFMDNNHYSFGSAWGDYDNDGFLDVYIANYNIDNGVDPLEENNLYHNNGDGTFTDVTEELNIGGGVVHSFMPVWLDYNKDGHLDLYVINDKINNANNMFRNNGDGTFTDVAAEIGLGVSIDNMSNSFADFDNDFDLDVYLSNSPSGNMFCENQDNIFIDIAEGLEMEIEEICWGANWIDVDNDSYQDLYVATVGALNNSNVYTDNYFFLNNGNGTFTNTTFDISVFPNDNLNVYSSSAGDFNNDGKIDIVSSNEYSDNSSLWENTSINNNNYIKVSLEGVVSNRDGVGSWIEVYTGNTNQLRFTHCGEDYLSQDSQHEIIGLGSASLNDSLIIKWPSGIVDSFFDIPVNQTVSVLEGESTLNTEIQYANLQVCYGDSVVLSTENDLLNIEWNTGDTIQSITTSVSGYFNFTAEDNLGFEVISDTVFVEIGSDMEIINGNFNTCFGECSGAITVDNLAGGFPPYEFSDALGNLCADDYEIIVVDSLGCSYELEFTVEEYSPIKASGGSIEGISCAGECDAISFVNASGGFPPYQFSWLGIYNLDSLCAGNYVVVVSDGYGCGVLVEFEIEDLEPLQMEVSIDNTTSIATVIVSGGTPEYEIEWSTGESSNSIQLNTGGEFWVQVTDAHDCTEIIEFSSTVSINEATANELKVFPNPSLDIFNIEYNGILSYKIYSFEGRIIEEKKNLQFPYQVNMKAQESGIYYIEFLGLGYNKAVKVVLKK